MKAQFCVQFFIQLAINIEVQLCSQKKYSNVKIWKRGSANFVYKCVLLL